MKKSEENKKARPLNRNREILLEGGTRNQQLKPQQFKRRGKTEAVETLDSSEWEQNSAQDSKKSETFIILLAVILISGTLVAGFFLLKPPRESLSQTSPVAPQGSAMIDGLNTPIPDSTLYDIPPLVVAKNFALTSDIEERLKWARNPEEVRQRLSQYPLQAREAIAHKITPLGEITTDTQHYLTFLVDFPDGEQRLLCVIGTPDGPKVDWDTYARYGTASWDDILAGKIKEATVRVFPALSDYYVLEFSDREKWISIALSSPDLKTPIYGYIDRTSEVAQDISSLRAKRVILDIQMTPDQIKNRLVEITGLRAMGWVE